MSKNSKILLASILALAFLMRVLGLSYALPQEFISDEFLMVAGSLKMLEAKTLRPYFGDIFYHQPLSAYISLGGIGTYLGWEMLTGKFTSLKAMADYYASDHAANARELLVVTRFLAVLFGVAMVYLMYLIGRDLFGSRVGLISAFFAVSELLLVETNHTGRVWSFLVFFIALSFLASVWVLRRGSFKDYIFSAVASSLSLATLLPGVLSFFSSLIPNFSLKGKKIWTAFLILFFAVFASVYLNPRGLGVIFLRFGEHSSIGASRVDWLHKFIDPFITLFNFMPVYFLLFFAALFILYKTDFKKFLLLVSFPMAYYLFIGPLFAYGNVERALTPFAPYIIIGAAFIVDRFFDRIRSKSLFPALILVLAFYSIFFSVLFDIKISRPDTRIEAIEWMKKNIPESERPNYYSRYVWGNESPDQFDAAEKNFKSKELVASFSPVKNAAKLKNNFFNNIQNPARVLWNVSRFGPIVEIYKVK